MRPIGYYVHHHGSGHLTRARQIAARLAAPVVGLSSLPRPVDWPGEWIELPRDDDAFVADDVLAGARAPQADPDHRPGSNASDDADSGGVLHWAPTGHAGYRGRMGRIARWVTQAHPALVVVDVSVEVTLLCRLLGVPVAVVAMRGDRSDRAHRAAYDAARLLIAPWPAYLPEPGVPARWAAKTVYCGGISRFDDSDVIADAGRLDPPTRTRTVAVLGGTGGGAMTADDVAAAASATPGVRWHLVRPGDDVRAELSAADVVVAHAGQNAVAEVAACRRPAVVVALPRPHGEQEATVAALEAGGLAATRSGWPEPAGWPVLLERARRLGGAGWARWSDGQGAHRAAAAIAAAADGRSLAVRTAVVTIVAGRHGHLLGQLAGLARGSHRPERLVVVTMDDPQAATLAGRAAPESGIAVEVVALGPDPSGRLPLAAARNAGARAAVAAGCDRLIFLDVDCIPGPGLVAGYVDALGGTGRVPDLRDRPAVYAGTVAYLPPAPDMQVDTEPDRPHGAEVDAGAGPSTYSRPPADAPRRPAYDLARLADLAPPHPARPTPVPGERLIADDVRLFWSLSFAVTAADLARIGGFCEAYTGYGGEDTDFAMALDTAGGRLVWLGDAPAYHQHHPTSAPPVQHAADIVRNANLFARRWGRHPMQGWLTQFERLGIAGPLGPGGDWVLTDTRTDTRTGALDDDPVPDPARDLQEAPQ